MRLVERVFICSLLIATVWLAGLGWFVTAITDYGLPGDAHSDGIVVLTGGGGRIESGLDLLAHGRGGALFISGVSKNVALQDVVSNVPGSLVEGVSLGKITLGHDAENTIGNAAETAKWVHKNHYQSLMIVTADYHMPRSLVEFHHSLPAITLIPASVKTGNYLTFDWVADVTKRNFIIAEYNKWIASHARHWVIK